FNNLEHPITLVGVASGGPVRLAEGRNTEAPCSVPRSQSPAVSTPSPSASSAAATSPPKPGASTRTGSPSAVPSAASTSPPPSPSVALGSASVKVTIPAGGCVELSRRAAHYLQVVELPDAVPNTASLETVFQFSTEDGQTFTIGPAHLPIAVPDS